MAKPKILVVVSHSLGELDIILPLFSEIKTEYRIDLEIIITVSKIYKQYKKCNFLRYSAKELDVKITNITLPNKFDYRGRALDKLRGNRIGRPIVDFSYAWLKYLKSPLLLAKAINCDAYMHEITNQRGSTFFLHWCNRLLGKPIFTYLHGHAVVPAGINYRRIAQAENSTFLLFDEMNRGDAENLGYKDNDVIGFPKLYDAWRMLLRTYISREGLPSQYVLIYSRQSEHVAYMDKDIYEYLFVSSYRVIRKKFNDIPIIIKPHPREDTKFAKSLIQEHGMHEVAFSTEHAAILAKHAILAISYWTSAWFDSLSMGIPTVEYFQYPKRFFEYETEGNLHKKLGIDTVHTEHELSSFVDRVCRGEYKVPEVIAQFSKIRNVGFVEKIFS